MKKYKFIFWDMDGTMANTYEGVKKCLEYALEPYGIHLEGEQEIRKFIGPPFRLSFRKYLGFEENQIEEAIARYRERYIPTGVYECELFEGIRETIQAFQEAGYIQVITSSKPEAQCRQMGKSIRKCRYCERHFVAWNSSMLIFQKRKPYFLGIPIMMRMVQKKLALTVLE